MSPVAQLLLTVGPVVVVIGLALLIIDQRQRRRAARLRARAAAVRANTPPRGTRLPAEPHVWQPAVAPVVPVPVPGPRRSPGRSEASRRTWTNGTEDVTPLDFNPATPIGTPFAPGDSLRTDDTSSSYCAPASSDSGSSASYSSSDSSSSSSSSGDCGGSW